jgi:hypothetical protein
MITVKSNPMKDLETLINKGVQIGGPMAEKIKKHLDPNTRSLLTQLEAKGINCESIVSQIHISLSAKDVGEIELSFPERTKAMLSKKKMSPAIRIKDIGSISESQRSDCTYIGGIQTLRFLSQYVNNLWYFARGETEVLEQNF